MTWWQTLIVATVPALVTLGGLMVQLRITHAAERERRALDATERQKDRDAAVTAREETRRNELNDYWREERRRAHIEFLTTLSTNLKHIEQEADRLESDDGRGDPYNHGFVKRLQPDAIEHMNGLLENLVPIAGAQTYASAGTAYLALMDADTQLLRLSGFNVTSEDRQEFSEAFTEARQFIDFYRGAIRLDLGTDSS